MAQKMYTYVSFYHLLQNFPALRAGNEQILLAHINLNLYIQVLNQKCIKCIYSHTMVSSPTCYLRLMMSYQLATNSSASAPLISVFEFLPLSQSDRSFNKSKGEGPCPPYWLHIPTGNPCQTRKTWQKSVLSSFFLVQHGFHAGKCTCPSDR